MRGYELKVKNNSQNKLQDILRIIVGIIVLGVFGWIYFMGIFCPNFNHSFSPIYRGAGLGLLYPLYFLFIPGHTNRIFPKIRYSGAIVSIFSFILALTLLFTTYPLSVL